MSQKKFEDPCTCIYCTDGPYHTNDGKDFVHFCEDCREEYVQYCVSCETFAAALKRLRRNQTYRDN